MRFLRHARDGGPESTVEGFWLVEAKRLLSVALLRFADGSRDAYHTHAFDALSWVWWGELREEMIDGRVRTYRPSLIPIITLRRDCHRVHSRGTSLVFILRGPWLSTWREFDPVTRMWTMLGHGRKIVDRWYEGEDA